MARSLPTFLCGTLAAAGFVLFLGGTLTSKSNGILPVEAFDPDLSRLMPACGQCHDPVPNSNGRVKVTVTAGWHSIDSGTRVPLSVQVTGGPGLGFGGFCMQSTLGAFTSGAATRLSVTGDAITHISQFANSWSFGLGSVGPGSRS